MTLNTHISFGGDCEAAFRFYERSIGGTVGLVLTWGASPMAAEIPPEWHDKICHASLTIGSNVLAGADVLPAQYKPPQGFQVLLGVDTPEEAERIFHALAEDGAVHLPLHETFWAVRFGALIDRFGVPWEINCEKRAGQ